MLTGVGSPDSACVSRQRNKACRWPVRCRQCHRTPTAPSTLPPPPLSPGRKGKTGIATTFINKNQSEQILLDLKHLLKASAWRPGWLEDMAAGVLSAGCVWWRYNWGSYTRAPRSCMSRLLS